MPKVSVEMHPDKRPVIGKWFEAQRVLGLAKMPKEKWEACNRSFTTLTTEVGDEMGRYNKELGAWKWDDTVCGTVGFDSKFHPVQ